MRTYTSLAICTLVVNWTLTLLAFLSLVVIFAYQQRRSHFGLDNTLVLISFVFGTILVALSTWAIVDEGQGQHQQRITDSQLSKAAKVRATPF